MYFSTFCDVTPGASLYKMIRLKSIYSQLIFELCIRIGLGICSNENQLNLNGSFLNRFLVGFQLNQTHVILMDN